MVGAVAESRPLLELARAKKVPIFYTKVGRSPNHRPLDKREREREREGKRQRDRERERERARERERKRD